MGFKITHPLFPHWLLVWPLWHTSTQRLRVPPDRMSGTTDTTKWPHCLHFYFVLVVFDIYRRIIFFTFSTVGSWISFPHLLLHFKEVILHQRLPQDKSTFLSSSVYLRPELLFIFTLRVFTDFYQCLNVITPVATKAIILEMYFVYHPAELISLSSSISTFSRLIALLDSCKEILLRHVKI